jgi:hypothetical protein
MSCDVMRSGCDARSWAAASSFYSQVGVGQFTNMLHSAMYGDDVLVHSAPGVTVVLTDSRPWVA